MKLHYSGFQGLQLGEVFGQGLGVVLWRGCHLHLHRMTRGKFCSIFFEVAILHVCLLPKLVFLSAGTCVV